MKYALITGATSGIGFEMAKILATKKNNLILVSRNFDKLSKLKTEFEEQYKVEVHVFAEDLSIVGAAQKVYDHTKPFDIDILINNSGFANYGIHTDIDLKENYGLMHLNIIALTEMCALYGADMKHKKEGKILNVASTAAFQPTPYFAAYGASKSYVLNFSEALNKELEDFNVSVTCLSPGPSKTNFFNVAKMDVSNSKHMGQLQPAQEVAQIGIDALFKRKMSVISGFKNWILANSNRFAPRTLSAKISKNIMKTN